LSMAGARFLQEQSISGVVQKRAPARRSVGCEVEFVAALS
jgi:hypothetical protein